MLLHNLLEGLINTKDLPNPNIENVTAKIKPKTNNNSG